MKNFSTVLTGAYSLTYFEFVIGGSGFCEDGCVQWMDFGLLTINYQSMIRPDLRINYGWTEKRNTFILITKKFLDDLVPVFR